MKKRTLMLLLLGLLLVLAPAAAGDPDDAEGGKDHPLFTRMPNFYIDDYETKDFDSYEFITDSKGKTTTVEGRKVLISRGATNHE